MKTTYTNEDSGLVYDLELIHDVLTHVGPLDADRIANYVHLGDTDTAFELAYSLRHMYWQEDIEQYSYDPEDDCY